MMFVQCTKCHGRKRITENPGTNMAWDHMCDRCVGAGVEPYVEAKPVPHIYIRCPHCINGTLDGRMIASGAGIRATKAGDECTNCHGEGILSRPGNRINH
jgi:DnaJ-class molecular chaperone